MGTPWCITMQSRFTVVWAIAFAVENVVCVKSELKMNPEFDGSEIVQPT